MISYNDAEHSLLAPDQHFHLAGIFVSSLPASYLHALLEREYKLIEFSMALDRSAELS